MSSNVLRAVQVALMAKTVFDRAKEAAGCDGILEASDVASVLVTAYAMAIVESKNLDEAFGRSVARGTLRMLVRTMAVEGIDIPTDDSRAPGAVGHPRRLPS